jgi:hypothetical protein
MSLPFFQKITYCYGRQIIVKLLEDLVLKRLLAISVPFVLKRLAAMVPVAQKKPQTILRRIQIRGRVDPHLAGHRASHGVYAARNLAGLEFLDCLLPLHIRALNLTLVLILLEAQL